MDSHLNATRQQSHVHHPLPRHSSWLGLTLREVENQLGSSLTKPLGSMNLDELLKRVWTRNDNAAVSIQQQASWSLAMTLTGKTVDQVWRDIQTGCKIRGGESSWERESTLGETTLEDFLVKAGTYVSSASIEPILSLDSALRAHKFSSQTGLLSPSPSIDELSDTPISSRKSTLGNLEKAIERRLKRKIKNRESAARSRARKQAYHNELVTKVAHLEEENSKLKKEQKFEKMMSCEFSEKRYQLRRTSSF
ncbi:ABSCISIC ACID-INSENSITIVE 5-like protein 3 [Striga hermonthica]|uniref:ABSCISIC ACID-INSENSITIVE 5-like protein 3 n=1 Tax=Striga hermonthica TaxID=68872 RepID=A0A9N7MQ11_STRHE|nr:ABSCISIC ACID-INSENSITIVE 5-like protein 3 [Striga hermonthica]